MPWTRLRQQGVQIRVVPHREWSICLADIEAVIDERTRVVAISQVSYFILKCGIEAIEAHVLHLSGQVRGGLSAAGWVVAA